LLLKNPRVNPAAEYNLPICIASSYGNPEIVRLLLNDPRVNTSDVNNVALLNAVLSGDLDIVRMLFEYGKLIF
jgi:ankyrin repeat protein